MVAWMTPQNLYALLAAHPVAAILLILRSNILIVAGAPQHPCSGGRRRWVGDLPKAGNCTESGSMTEPPDLIVDHPTETHLLSPTPNNPSNGAPVGG